MHTYNGIGILDMKDDPFCADAVELIHVSMAWAGSVIGSAMASATGSLGR